MSPLERYQQDLIREDFREDAAQAAAVQYLQALYERLILSHTKSNSPSLLQKFFERSSTKSSLKYVQGLYLWGGVGRGKTYLMDCFFESLPFEQKMRVHFHRFMRRVHAELKNLGGYKNPLEKVADIIAKEARVICFDEFFVSDISDAMILGTLMESLFKRKVTLVATSNCHPDDLYKNGLQRARFLPVIAQLKQHTLVVNVDGNVDYRLRTLVQAELYHSPLDAAADASLATSFTNLAGNLDVRWDAELEIEGRSIRARAVSDGVVWFDFVELCDGPRSQNDYIELAREYHSVILSNIPWLSRETDDQARRLISLIDEFYDRQVKLVISAAKPLNELYGGGKLDFEFQRTLSRLLEMQSREYLARPHKP